MKILIGFMFKNSYHIENTNYMKNEIFNVQTTGYWFAILLMLHTVMLLVADLTGAKLIEIPYLNLVASVGFITYGFSVLLLLCIRDLFGSAYAKKTVNIGFFSLIVSTFLVTLAINVPPASFWQFQSGYEETLGRLWRLVTFGYLSYLIAQHLEVTVFNFLTKFKSLPKTLRGGISAISTQMFETTFFMFAVFYGTVPSILDLIGGQFLLKIILLLISVPIAFKISDKIRNIIQTNNH